MSYRADEFVMSGDQSRLLDMRDASIVMITIHPLTAFSYNYAVEETTIKADDIAEGEFFDLGSDNAYGGTAMIRTDVAGGCVRVAVDTGDPGNEVRVRVAAR